MLKINSYLAILLLILIVSMVGLMWNPYPTKSPFIFLYTTPHTPLKERDAGLITAAFTTLRATHIAPIISVSLPGSTSHTLENLTRITSIASDASTPLWLQVHLSPTFETPSESTTTLSSSNKQLDTLAAAAKIYAGQGTAHERTCTIVLFNDDTPYAAKYEGGYFWLEDSFVATSAEIEMDGSRSLEFAPRTSSNDILFITNMAALYVQAFDTIRTVNPLCRIGIYPNLSTMLRTYKKTPLLSQLLSLIPPTKQPAFVMVRSYSKSHTTYDMFATRTTEHMQTLRNILPRPILMYLVGQLHTTNTQGSGAGRTPSRTQLMHALELAQTLPIDAYGYTGTDRHESAPVKMETVTTTGVTIPACVYDHTSGVHMINDACTFAEDSEPFAPNTRAHFPLIDPDPVHGLARWNLGIALLKKL